ncbi:unnamed protein product [Acanthoscelides obtectus]|uniref:Zinc finger MYM-type protein 1-like n=1 Tax=Acanthoscelides obtectus TaxID=200917 RepID=A0A9P0L7B5_ACAOB|nr:unnamed protein product [Acanthoscelides obtectus]CAK1687790.1 General transcription factor II-I repeat domain-containing protein 2 [Acanthoscelides obtectus]
MCETQWTERHDSLLQFESKFEKIVEVLNIISNWKDREASSKAESLKTAITSTQFIVSLKCLCDMLALTVNLVSNSKTEAEVMDILETISKYLHGLNSNEYKNLISTRLKAEFDLRKSRTQDIIDSGMPLYNIEDGRLDNRWRSSYGVWSLVGLCHKDESFLQFLCYHCVIHQQALCGHFLKLSNVMQLVVEIVNKIRAQALQRRLFKTLADEIDCQYGELLRHSEVRWLNRGRVRKRFNDIISAIVQFFKQHDERIPELENSILLRGFGFLMDITEKLNELNLQLQGRDK